MKRSFLLLLIIVGSFFIASCADDPVVPGIDLKLTRVVFETAKNTGLIADVEASINHADRSVLAQINGGELSALEPTLYALGAGSYEPSGKQDFSNPVFYNIISRDGFSSLGYMVTVLPGGDAYDVALARQWLDVVYAAGESALAVTNNVTLASSSTNGCTIAWQSSGTNIVVSGTSGAVYRPPFSAGNVSVTLTATISKGNASTTKTFTLLIIRQGITDQERVNEDVGAATIGYAGGDSATSITKNLTLPASGTANGSTFVWTSSNAAVIANNGTVTRPDYGPAGDALVTLHLRGTKNAASAERKFVDLKVLQKEDPAITNVAAVKAALAIGYAADESASAVTNNITLPTLENGVAISWASSVPGTIATDGTVVRPAFTAGDASVTLTASLSQTTFVGSPERTGIKTFTLTVIKLPPNDAEAVAATKAALAIVYSTGESAAAIKNDLTLATSGLYGATVAWASSIPATISTTGVVTRPSYSDGDATVTLTAAISRGVVNDTKEFANQIVIKNVPSTDDEKVATDKANLEIGYAAGDSASSVTKNLTLATTGTNAGVTIAWGSSDAGVIGTDGIVTRPAIGQPDASVTMTATITSGSVNDTKVFNLTVKALQPNVDLAGYSLVLMQNAGEKVTVDLGTFDVGNGLGQFTPGSYIVVVRNRPTLSTWAAEFSPAIQTNNIVLFYDSAEVWQCNGKEDDGAVLKNATSTIIDQKIQVQNNICRRQADGTWSDTEKTTSGAAGAPSGLTGYTEPIYIYEIAESDNSLPYSNYYDNYVIFYIP